MDSIKKIIVIVSLLPLFAGCSTTTKWISDSFERNQSAIDTVTIVFPQVNYYEKVIDKKEIKRGRSIYVSNNIRNGINEIIKKGKFLKGTIPISMDSVAIDEWLSNQFKETKNDLTKISDSIYVTQEGNRLLPINGDLKKLTDKVKSKYFICVKGIAYSTSEDAKRFDMIQTQTFKLFYGNNYAYGYQWFGLQLKIYLVEKSTGRILWSNYNKEDDNQYFPLSNEDVEKLLTKLLSEN